MGRLAAVFGALLGALGVVAGAFGAHELAGRVSPSDLEIWKTAAHYQQVHAVLLVALGLSGTRGRALAWATGLLVVGILVFSGTLYAMVLGGPRILGAVTPIGGTCLIAGWLSVLGYAVAAARSGR